MFLLLLPGKCEAKKSFHKEGQMEVTRCTWRSVNPLYSAHRDNKLLLGGIQKVNESNGDEIDLKITFVTPLSGFLCPFHYVKP